LNGWNGLNFRRSDRDPALRVKNQWNGRESQVVEIKLAARALAQLRWPVGSNYVMLALAPREKLKPNFGKGSTQ